MPESAQHVLVFDIGGSHIAAGLCTRESYALLGLTRAPLPEPKPDPSATHFSAASFLRLLHALANRVLRAAQLDPSRTSAVPLTLAEIAGASVAVPGPFDYARGVSHMRHKLHSLYDVDLKSAIAARFDWRPSQVRFLNDADSFLLGEVGAGAARGFSHAVGLTLGTGIGSAFAIDARIVTSGPGVPPGGEIWNLPYRDSTIETFVSTHFLRQRYRELTGEDAEVSAMADLARIDLPCPQLDGEFLPGGVDGASGVAAAPAPASIQMPANPVAIAPTPGSGLPASFVDLPGVGLPRPRPGDPELHCFAREAFLDFGRNLGDVLNHVLHHNGDFFPPGTTAAAPEAGVTAANPSGVIVLGGGIARASQFFVPAIRKTLKNVPAHITLSTLRDEAPLIGAAVHFFTA